ncbi:hypothetical protein [Thiocystis violascens]|nr:hypothetical protein [Thiocystis violascens]
MTTRRDERVRELDMHLRMESPEGKREALPVVLAETTEVPNTSSALTC